MMRHTVTVHALLLFVFVFVFVFVMPINGQRDLPAPRDTGTGQIIYGASTLRGTNYFLANQRNYEHLWSNILPGQPNALSMPSVETHMAHLARNGFNSIRVWSSYASYLFHHFVENPPSNNFPARVREFLDRADTYELGVSLALFNTIGSISASLLTTCNPTPGIEGVHRAPLGLTLTLSNSWGPITRPS